VLGGGGEASTFCAADRTGRWRCRGMGLASGGQTVLLRAEGGRQRQSRGTREAKVEEGATCEVGDDSVLQGWVKAATRSKAGVEAAACSKVRVKDGRR
jgi:hypothetical protein